jgi:queuine tRNA-ribosyltransferase
MFKIKQKSKKTAARTGVLQTNHGEIKTPFFMPIATKGAVKNLSAGDMKDLEAQILLSNTYHLMLRPGVELIKKSGGLHKFMRWDRPILTDSGGFQVFSLANPIRIKSESDTNLTRIYSESSTSPNNHSSLVKLSEEGVEFKSYIDGSTHFLTPEKCIEMQSDFGVDIAMCLDQCVPNPCDYDKAKKAMGLTSRWAQRCKDSRLKIENSKLFAIVQGSVYKDLRLQSAKDLIKIGFDGYAIGGLAVGESSAEMYKVLDYLCPELPEDKPRYLMGVGTPENIVEAVKRGVDMFDCVIPTREARHGRIYKFNSPAERGWGVKVNFYKVLNIHNEQFKEDFSVVDEECDCATCQGGYTKAYLRHLFSVNENLAQRLATIHNLYFYLDLMRKIRHNIGINIL